MNEAMTVNSMTCWLLGENIDRDNGQWKRYCGSAYTTASDIDTLWRNLADFSEREDYRNLVMRARIETTPMDIRNAAHLQEVREGAVTIGPAAQKEIWVMALKNGETQMVGPFTTEADAKFALQLASED